MIEIKCDNCSEKIDGEYYKGDLMKSHPEFYSKTDCITVGSITSLAFAPDYHFHLCIKCCVSLMKQFRIIKSV